MEKEVIFGTMHCADGGQLWCEVYIDGALFVKKNILLTMKR